jgi:hypothetical protein
MAVSTGGVEFDVGFASPAMQTHALRRTAKPRNIVAVVSLVFIVAQSLTV